MAGLAPEQVRARLTGDGIKNPMPPVLDPTERALQIMADHGLKLVKTGDRALREEKRRLQFRRASINFRLFFSEALAAFLFGVCRFIGDPKQPSVKSIHNNLP